MRIGFDASPLIQPSSGIGWHTFYLFQSLLDLCDTEEFVGYIPTKAILDRELQAWAKSGRLRWVRTGPFGKWRRGHADALDLYHGPNFKMETEGRYGGIVTIHDVWLDRHPEFSKKLFGQGPSYQRTKRTLTRARCVITVSHHAAREIQEVYGLPAERIIVIPNGVSEFFHPESDQQRIENIIKKFNIPTPQFILCMSGGPRKNHSTLLRAYAQIPMVHESHCLVAVGNPADRYGDLRTSAGDLGIGHRMICTGKISREDLRILYSEADLFVFPSIYEGFGMPVLEAMACGVPVITSNTTALPEVAGDAAVLINPTNPEELAQAIRRAIHDGTLKATLQTKGYQRAKQFTWTEAARRTLHLYRQLCP